MWWNFLNNLELKHLVIPIIGLILFIAGFISIVKWIVKFLF